MKVLVSGGAGYVGSFTTALLISRGIEVDVIDDLSTGHRQALVNSGIANGNFFEVNLLNSPRLREILSPQSGHADAYGGVYDGVIHFAAKSLVGESLVNPEKYYRNNICGSLNLFEAAHAAGVKNFIFSSSAAVYGDPCADLSEEHPTRPINPYGRSKLAVEQLLSDLCKAHGLRAIALRYFNAAGAAEDGSIGEDHYPETHLIPLTIKAALGHAGPLQIYGTDYDTDDGTAIRDYVHVSDLAEAHLLALNALDSAKSGHFEALNVGSATGNSVREIIESVESITGKPVPYRVAPRRAGDPQQLVANSTKIRSQLGWQPRFSDISMIIRSAYTWHQKHPFGYADRQAPNPHGGYNTHLL